MSSLTLWTISPLVGSVTSWPKSTEPSFNNSFSKLSKTKQRELLDYINKFFKQENNKKIDLQEANEHLLSLGGSMKTDISLSDEELDEAIKRSYYARDEKWKFLLILTS